MAKVISHLAHGHGVDHVGPYLHLALALLITLTGVKGIRTSRNTKVKAAKCYLFSVSLVSLLVVGGFIFGFVMAATHTRPEDIKLNKAHGNHHGRDHNDTPIVVGGDTPCYPPDSIDEVPPVKSPDFLEASSSPVEDRSEAQVLHDSHRQGSQDHVSHSNSHDSHNSHHAKSDHDDKDDRKHGNAGHDHDDKDDRKHGNSGHGHNDHKHGGSGHGHDDKHNGGHKSKHHGPPPPRFFLVATLVSSVVCSLFIIPAVKLLKARKAIKRLATQPSIVMVAPQPQFQVSQAMPVYANYASPNLMPTGSQV